MWKAEKIELIKNSNRNYTDWSDLNSRSSLLINGIVICNDMGEEFSIHWLSHFQANVCSYCGEEGCNPNNILMMRRQGNSLLIIPAFDEMDPLTERIPQEDIEYGSYPPHEWYERGILIFEGEFVEELFRAVPGLRSCKIPEITKEEMDSVIEWERLVNEKPKGFMSEE